MRTTRLALLLIAVTLGGGCRRLLSRHLAKQSTELTQSYASKTGFLTVHYPAAFAARTVGTQSSVLLARGFDDGSDEAVVFVAIANPASDELDEFARVSELKNSEHYNKYQQLTSGRATLLGVPAVRAHGSWETEKKHLPYLRTSYVFLRNGKGYIFSYVYPQAHAAEDEPLLEKIIQATVFAD
jgi:hypothetical protein